MSDNGAGSGSEPVGAALAWRAVHGADRQPAIRMDAVRQSDAPGKWLEHRRDPGRVQHLHRHGDLAHPNRGLHRRSPRTAHRSAPDDHLRWRAGRHRLGDQRLRRLAGDALCWRGDLGHWRRRDLCHLRRQCGQVVPRSAWPRGRIDRRGLRCRRGADRDPDQPGDRSLRLCLRLPLVRRGAGHHPAGRRADAARPDAGNRAADSEERRGATIGTQLHQHGGAALAGILAALLHVPPGVGERTDGDRTACADRPGLRPVATQRSCSARQR